MNAKDAIEHVLTLAQQSKLSDVDVLFVRSDSLTLNVRDTQIEKVEQSTGLSLGVRVVHEGRTGIASTEKLQADSLKQTLENARENALLQDPTEVLMPDPPASIPEEQTLDLFHPELNELSVQELGDLGKNIENSVHQQNSEVLSIPYLGVSRDHSEAILASTRGLYHTQSKNSVGAYCGVLLEGKGQRKSGFSTWHQRKWDSNVAESMAKQALGRASKLLGATAISETIPVVLDEYCAPQLLSTYWNAFYAQRAQRGLSRLKGKLGETIAAPFINLVDDPHLANAPGSEFLDSEGSLTAPLPLIQDGVFKKFLYHIESARKDGVSSTGHAGRSTGSGIHTSAHNLVMSLGGHSLEELCAIPETCLLITELEGAAGCNPISGDISIGVQGMLMKQGKAVHPVDSVTIAGNFFDVLQNIKALGNTYQPNLSSRFIPALLIEGLSISS